MIQIPPRGERGTPHVLHHHQDALHLLVMMDVELELVVVLVVVLVPR